MSCPSCGGACDTLTADQILDQLEAELGERDDDGRIVAPAQHPASASLHVQLMCCGPDHKGDRILEVGSPGAGVSHGYCATCLAVEMKKL